MASKPSPLRLSLPTNPADLPLRTSLSPHHIRQMLQMRSSENFWRVMHSGRPESHPLTPNITPSPTRTGANTSRPATSISSLTVRENLRLGSRRDFPAQPLPRITTAGIGNSPSGPNEMDFKRVLERLNRVTMTGGVDSRKIVLTDIKPAEIILDYGEVIYVRVATLGQNAPLQVNIRRAKGKVVTYASKTNPEPMEALCDATFKGDLVVIADVAQRFRCKNVYLNITALEDSLFTVRLHFGRLHPTFSTTSKLPQLPDGEELDWMALLPQPSAKTRSSRNIRNFVEENRNSSPCEQREKRDWKVRRDAVLRKLRLNRDQKKEKALHLLNRREIQRLERARLAQEAVLRDNRQKKEKKWLGYLSFAVFLESLAGKLQLRMKEIAVEKKKNAVARKIQRNFKLQLGVKSQDIALLRFLHSAELLTHHSFLPLYHRSQWKVYLCLRQAAKNASIRKAMERFCWALSLLQRNWRLAIKRKKRLFERLAQAWSQAFALFMDNIGKKKLSRKGKRSSKELPSARYFAISSSVRQRVLLQYYNAQKLQYRLEVRRFLREKGHFEGAEEPVFALDLREEAINRLIEQAADATEQIAAD